VNFSFTRVTEKEMIKEIEVLNIKKAGTFMNIPTKKLKDAKEEIAKPLTQIWNNEILTKMKFPSKLKLADITPLYKKLEAVYKKNYRPVSLLPVASFNFLVGIFMNVPAFLVFNTSISFIISFSVTLENEKFKSLTT
jgi:hypothetical protein